MFFIYYYWDFTLLKLLPIFVNKTGLLSGDFIRSISGLQRLNTIKLREDTEVINIHETQL